MKKLIIAVVLLVVALIVLSQSVYTIDMTKQGVVLQLGQYIKTVDEPGLYFKVPFLQAVTRYEKRLLVSDALPGEYLTADKKRLKVDHVTRWRIVDPFLFYKTVRDEAGALARLEPIVFAEFRNELASYDFADIIATEREAIMDAVAARASGKALEFGIELVDVRIKRADLPREVEASVFARMQAERQRIALAYRAEGEEVALKTRAEADRERTVIQAEAYEESQKLRGDGDAKAIEIYAAAFEKDPEFYDFLRTLQAYETFLGQETTLVLSSDSELFKYLESPEVPE